METCTTCNGDGRCLSCGGSGTLGKWITHRCDTCHGRRVCGRCNGSGQVKGASGGRRRWRPASRAGDRRSRASAAGDPRFGAL